MSEGAIFVCGSAWGMGASFKDSGELICYGFPVVDNPHNFSPNYEVCTEKEIASWEQSKKSWDEKHEKV